MATSKSPLTRLLRRIYFGVHSFSLPAPRLLVSPVLWAFLAAREFYRFAMRVFICEPAFKSRCRTYGKNLHTDCYLHNISGAGDIVVGDDVRLDGRISFVFASRYTERPVLEIGDGSGVAHDCRLIVGKRISIGRNCRLSGGSIIMDSNGHAADPEARLGGQPLSADDVRPVVIGDGVWIGMRCIIFPGVRIGEGSVISAGSVVRTHVPAYAVVAGNPARVMFRLRRPEAPSLQGTDG